jgi:FkbM family methyltransferase
MNILVYGTIIGPGGIAHHTREFTKRLAKFHNIKFKNFNVPKNWDGMHYPDMYKNFAELDDIHHKILHQQSLWTPAGELVDHPLGGYSENFVPDVHLVMAEANHYYHYHNRIIGSDSPIIAYFPWETSEIKSEFFNQLLEYTQVWVPSQWQYDILVKQGFPELKLKVVSEGVDSLIFNPISNKNSKFTFLHIGTWEDRKSTYEICKAFIDEYGNNPYVELRLSIHNKFRDQDDPHTEFKKYGLPIPNNIVFLDTLSETEYISEIQNADVYVSCARGEGWNLPLIQSMASGVPSIWSKVGGQLQFAIGAELGCDVLYETPVNSVSYINSEPWFWTWGQGFPGNLYEPDYNQLSHYMKDVYVNYSFYKRRALEFSERIRRDFDWDVSVSTANKLLMNISNLIDIDMDTSTLQIPNNTTHIYYLIHSFSFGDTLAATPTVRYLSQSHQCKINVVTHNSQVFTNNPNIHSVFSFEDYKHIDINNHNIIYESFTSPGKKDERGIEKKFGHIDIRQLHAMDLGFQLPPENLHCEFYPNSMELDVALPDMYVVLHITNNWANRTWDYQKWKKLIQWLSDNKIFTVLIGFGHREIVHHSISNIPLEKQCPSFNNLYGLDLANQGTMSDMWHVINDAKCIVTMDTGPLHLAGTTDTHIIQLGSAVHPAYRAPYRNGSQNYKYNYVGGECNLFCNSNLKYNVKEWGHINAVPPQNGCSENYSEFKCHPHVSDVTKLLEGIVDVNAPLLVNTEWDGTLFRYNFSRKLDKSANVVLRDLDTGFKIYSVYYPQILPTEGSYWLGIDTDVNIKRSAYIELYIDGDKIESHTIFRDNSINYTINDIPLTTDMFHYFSPNEDIFMLYYEVFIRSLYSKYGVSVNKGDVVLDIGANHGFFSLYSVHNGASKVFSVEPIDGCYLNLKKLSNTFSNILPMNYAVFDKDGTVEFALNENATPGSFVIGVNYTPVNLNTTTVLVNSIHINNLLNTVGHIDFLKIDCEGAEDIIFDIIDVDKLIKIPQIIIEAHTDEIKIKIKNKLEKLNYTVNIDKFSEGVYMMYCKLNIV